MTRTEIPHEFVEAFCAALAKRPVRAPGNPFPLDSPWGRELDRMYAEDRRNRRAPAGRGRAA